MGIGEVGGNLRSAARCILHVLAFLAVALFPKRGGQLHVSVCASVCLCSMPEGLGEGEECMVYEPCTRLVAAPMPLPMPPASSVLCFVPYCIVGHWSPVDGTPN